MAAPEGGNIKLWAALSRRTPTVFSRSSRQLARLLALALLVLVATGPSSARADLIRLSNGGELHGVVDRDASTGATGGIGTAVPTEGDIVIETLSGLVVTVDRADVAFVTFRRRVVEEYEFRARRTPREVEPQRELADWCHANALTDERDRHLEVIVELAPDDRDARERLRHVQHNGEWMSRDEQMQKQGYVKHRNRWVTRQELALIEKTDAEREAERTWYAEVKRMAAGLRHRSLQRRQESLVELSRIEDPHAIPALIRNFAEHGDRSVRMLFVDILGNVPGGAAVGPLVQRSLYDPDYEVRYQSLNRIGEERGPAAVGMFVAALDSDDNQIVRRAASALGRFGGEQIVPDLVDALVTRHEYRVAQKTMNGTMGFRADGSGMVNPGQLAVSPELAATIQQGAIVHTPGSPHARVKWVRVKYDHRNEEVHAALVKLTGEDFGYDERTWRLWWASKKNGG